MNPTETWTGLRALEGKELSALLVVPVMLFLLQNIIEPQQF